MTTKHNLQSFQSQLLDWFASKQRDFPWRQNPTPYRILVAEKLLQQTQASDVVVNVYKHLIAEYPSPSALARADAEEIEILFRPLGLIYRGRELWKMAQELVRDHAGKVPNDLKKLLGLTGVGDYGARAVLSFAFEEDIPVVDTNIARILYRVFDLQGKMPSNPARNRKLIHLAGSLIPAGDSRQFNWALLDLGALVCKASKPQCEQCPLQDYCAYYEARRTGNATT